MNKAILWCPLLFVSGLALAEPSILGAVAQQAAKNAATSVAPDAVKKLEAASQDLQNANALKQAVTNTSDDVKDQAKDVINESVKQQLIQVAPSGSKKAIELLDANKENLNKLKSKYDAMPEEEKNRAKQKAVEKAMELLR